MFSLFSFERFHTLNLLEFCSLTFGLCALQSLANEVTCTARHILFYYVNPIFSWICRFNSLGFAVLSLQCGGCVSFIVRVLILDRILITCCSKFFIRFVFLQLRPLISFIFLFTFSTSHSNQVLRIPVMTGFLLSCIFYQNSHRNSCTCMKLPIEFSAVWFFLISNV